MATNVTVHEEVIEGDEDEWQLCFQWVTYNYEDARPQDGYRFIWRRPNGNLQPARGQARIPDAETMFKLIRAATGAGWFVSVEKESTT